MAQKVKIFFIDLDDTLLDSDKNVSEANLEAIKKAQAAGMTIVISTGRSLGNSQYLIDIVKPDYYAGMNGTLLLDAQGNIMFKQTLDSCIVRRAINAFNSLGLEYLVYSHTNTYCLPTKMEAVKARVSLANVIHPLGDDIERLSIAKFFAFCSTAAEVQALIATCEKIGDIVPVSVSECSFDILGVGQSKAVAAKILCEKLNIAPAEAAAMGDSENDREILEFVGHSIAPANAIPSIKAMCKHIVASNNDSGVAEAINKML
jgi:Cof subfamily protein (haloacid dehalogenase superfamily)